ncbi:MULTISPECIES: hypothetical protein [unclassified Chryseobacterium]|uniref:hypothetical protein n=1 Tax=unclassified Chryseobacterium TaxID=2593645 RepID=UPI002269B311|nr:MULTISPECIES: hypothetical protein [unclassified Chryseobacterium]
MESYKKEMHTLHERNMQSAINEKTISLKVGMESLQKENLKLSAEIERSKNNYTKVVIAAIVAIVIGFALAKAF